MASKFRVIIAALFLLSGAAMMLTLGVWQLQRLEWKNNIIAQLDQEYAKNVNESRVTLEKLNTVSEESTLRYGTLSGRLRGDKVLFYGPKPHDGEIGYHVIAPLQINNQNILINIGWISENNRDAISLPRQLTISGIIRRPDWNRFTPNNNPESDVWTKLDTDQIAKAKDLRNLSLYILYATEVSPNIANITMVHDKWYPRNKHKQYAVFWFSMAVIFLGFFGFYARTKYKKIV